MKINLLSRCSAAIYALSVSAFFFGNASAVEVVPVFTKDSCAGNCGATTGGVIGSSPTGGNYGYISTENGTTAAGSLNLKDEVGSIVPLGAQTGSSLTSSSFSVNANDHLGISFTYVTSDGGGFSDYAWARLLGPGGSSVWLFEAMSNNQGKNPLEADFLNTSKYPAFSGSVVFDGKNSTFNTIPDKSAVDWNPIGAGATCFLSGGNGCGYGNWTTTSFTFSQAGNYQLQMGVRNWGDAIYQSGLAFDYQGYGGVTSGAGVPSPVPEPSTYVLLSIALALFGPMALRRRAKDSS
jgi:hypothetical protein